MSLPAAFWQSFRALPTGQQALLLIIGLLLFLIGWLLATLAQRKRSRRHQAELSQLQRQRDEYQRKLNAANDEQERLAREIVHLTGTNDELHLHVRELNDRVNEQQAALERSANLQEQLSATNASYATTIEDQNDQIIGLKTRNERLLSQSAEDVDQPGPSLEDRLIALEARVNKLSGG